ncbi:hypothetical protein Pflav_013760 [Phytohabitans flavus]|uniref:Uncharacterized protein n=1 Tax=Phytohabitans flavus TaxID=1076124 RepID=A0A6F8XMD0_9ACTN|nr:hypothetical protein Pflav_013760 [Phytohabitans flavus]
MSAVVRTVAPAASPSAVHNPRPARSVGECRGAHLQERILAIAFAGLRPASNEDGGAPRLSVARTVGPIG